MSDSNKDFVIGSSSVIINDSDNEINLMPPMSNPMSNQRNRPEEIPPIILSGHIGQDTQKKHKNLTEMLVNSKTTGNSPKRNKF